MTTTQQQARTDGQTAVLLIVIAYLAALPLIGLGLVLIASSATDNSGDPLAGLGYVIGGALAAPGVLTAVFASIALAIRRRWPRAALITAGAALGVLALAFGLGLVFFAA